MLRFVLRTCLGFLCVLFVNAQGTAIDPRGARPVEHGTRSEKCASQQEWPFCTTDEWGPKCPSGCRIQGLMNKYDHDLLKKVEKIRGILGQNEQKHRSTDSLTQQTYDYVKEQLRLDTGHSSNYYDLAQDLRQRITHMKIKIDRQLGILAALKDRVKDQVVEMQRLEVDIDIKLRSCKGSCAHYQEYQVDHESYVALDKQVNQLDSQTAQSIETTGALFVMKSKPLREALVESIYKSRDTEPLVGQQVEDMFPEVNMVHLVIEREGSITSPATISKDPVCLRLEKQREGRTSPTQKKQHCHLQSRVALCSDDDWTSKCPSGCRLQGALWQLEDKMDKHLRALCKTAMGQEKTALKSMTLVTDIYKKNRQVLVKRHLSELNFVEQAQRLSRNLTSLQKSSSRMSLKLEAVHHQVLQQLEDLYRTEVDIGMKLQACTGSCQSVSPLNVNHESYQDSMERLDKASTNRLAANAPSQKVPRLKLLAADLGLVPSTEYKTIPMVQRELLTEFEDIEPNQIIMEDSVESDIPCSELS